MKTRYDSFADFYPFYLSEHANRTCRRLHFIGTSAALVFMLHAIESLNAWWILASLLTGYAFAWCGHFFFEHNRPATFAHPFYSFVGDWVMWREILLLKIPF
ncbi:MAG TPA: Mpo1-like protein [Burkholderiales bacterium]|nr:Mpo1-like protein [Burkholderiales bacterium]